MEMNRFEYVNQIEDAKTRLDVWLDLLRELSGNIATTRNQFALYWLPAMGEALERHIIDSEYIMQQIRDIKLNEE